MQQRSRVVNVTNNKGLIEELIWRFGDPVIIDNRNIMEGSRPLLLTRMGGFSERRIDGRMNIPLYFKSDILDTSQEVS